MKIALIQSDLTWENKEENLKRFDQHFSQISTEVDLILLPEMFSTGFSMKSGELAESMNGNSVKWMQAKAKEKNALIGGSLIIVD
ncbi:MAG: nitrilase family protein, partial [Bacteroidetes bacterium]|nr:nitrilase family protein [Bacteroidota bacterium]